MKRWPIFLLAICALVPLLKPIFRGQTIGEFDVVGHLAPWNGPAPARPFDLLQADSVLQFYNWRQLVLDSWGKGQLPAWDPYEMAGKPLLANSQSGALYPPHILVGLLHIPTPQALLLLAWAHLFWAGLGAYLLTRKLGGTRAGGSVAGVAFALSPFMLGWAALPSVITTVSWIPWMLAILVSLFEGEGKIGRKVAGLAVCSAMMLLGGHLQFCAYGLFASGVILLWLFIQRLLRFPARRGGTALRACAATLGLGLGVMLSTPQLLPVLSYAKFSHRANVASPQGYAAYIGGATPIYALQGIAFPTALGSPAKPMSNGFPGENGYWPALTKPGADFSETALSLGPVVFLLLAFGLKPKGASAALAAIGILALLLALGTPLNEPLYFLVPGWSASGSPGRVAVLFVLAGSVLAGMAVTEVANRTARRVGLTAAIAGICGLLIALLPVVFGISYSSAYGIPAEKLNPLIKGSIIDQFPTIMSCLAVAIVGLLAYKYLAFNPAAARYGSLLLPMAILTCAVMTLDIIPSGNPLGQVRADPDARYAFVNSSGSWPLIGGLPTAIMPPDTASGSRIHELGGYDSLLHRDSVAMLRGVDGSDPTPAANGNMMFVKPGASLGALQEAGVTQVWSARVLPQLGQGIDDAGLIKYAFPGPGRVSGVPDARIVAENLDSIAVNATGPGRLVLRDRMMPGWSVSVDGKDAPILALDSSLGKALWRGVDLPPGTHSVIFRYSPPGLDKGLVLAGAAALVCLILLALTFTKKGSLTPVSFRFP